MKSLNEQVSEILNTKSSKSVKQVSLVKLGLMPYEISLLLDSIKSTPRAAKFNASRLTFGVEIESYNFTRDQLISVVSARHISIQSESYNHSDTKSYYKIVSDCSIHGVSPNEVVSPILKGKKGLDSLKNVCDSLNAVGAKVNKSTGLHIHFDASKVSDAHFCNIIRNYQKCEKAIDSFMPISRRDNNNCFCKTLQNFNLSNVDTKERMINVLGTRYTKVNAEAYLRHNTIEFRQHSGTTEYAKIANWINFLRCLIQYSFDHDCDICNTIEEIPFLSVKDKDYFINRRNQLN